jgi:signal transduction histidine kinase
MTVSIKNSGTTAHRPLRVLLVEDSQPDAILIARALERGGFQPEWERVETSEAMQLALEQRPWDLILADHAMPQFSATAALELVKKHGVDIPFIIVSGHIDEETAVAAMKAGAHDYVMKERLARLVPAVDRELREAEVRRARAKSERELMRAHEELEERVEKRTAALKSANLKLQKMIEERTRLENELLDIAENERKRIGFDLHDDLGQKLTGVSMMIKGLQHKLTLNHHPDAQEVGNIHSVIEQIVHHTHDLAHNFSSLDVRGDDLPAVLKGLAANVRKMFNIDCTFSAKGAIPDLPQGATMQFYKIAQEAISNAIKHGKAKQVSIGLSRGLAKLVMTIDNDGLPFSEPASAKDRMGLRIMNYRANTLGASLRIEPKPKEGTLLTCVLPLKNGSKPERPNIRGHGSESVTQTFHMLSA